MTKLLLLSSSSFIGLPKSSIAEMIEVEFSQSGSSTIGLDTDSVASEGRPDG